MPAMLFNSFDGIVDSQTETVGAQMHTYQNKFHIIGLVRQSVMLLMGIYFLKQ